MAKKMLKNPDQASPFHRGFTLVELLLYIGVAATILLVSVVFMQILLESRVKNQTILEVEQQGLQAMDRISEALRGAEEITSPAIGDSSSSLTLDVVEADNDPTLVDLSQGVIHLTEGGGPAVPLTNSRVTASSLMFENLSRSGTPGTVRISFTLSYVNTSARQEYEYQKTFFTSASLRQP